MKLVSIEPIIERLDQLYKDAEFWFRSAELDVVDGTYFPTDPTKKKMTDSMRARNKQIKKKNFISAKEKITKIMNEYLSSLKQIVYEIDFEERKALMAKRYEMKKMIKACEHYIDILS